MKSKKYQSIGDDPKTSAAILNALGSPTTTKKVAKAKPKTIKPMSAAKEKRLIKEAATKERLLNKAFESLAGLFDD